MKAEVFIENELVKIAVCGQIGEESQGQKILDLLVEHSVSSRSAVLWDAREATVQLGPGIFCRFARKFLLGTNANQLGRRVAVMVNDPTTASLFLILKTVLVNSRTRYRLFQDESDARAWLTSTATGAVICSFPRD